MVDPEQFWFLSLTLFLLLFHYYEAVVIIIFYIIFILILHICWRKAIYLNQNTTNEYIRDKFELPTTVTVSKFR